MSSRFSSRDTRSSLFAAYDSSAARTKSQSPARPANGHLHPNGSANGPSLRSTASHPGGLGAYPGASTTSSHDASSGQFRAATPNRRGQYSDAVLSELESQNEEQLEGMSAKVRMLKDITTAIGEEIRTSSALAEKMNDSFENTRTRLRGTMNRMLRMAQKTGVGWKVWLGFFAFVVFLFWYVWLF